jgi:hypothetical protein
MLINKALCLSKGVAMKLPRFVTPEGQLIVQPGKNGLLMGNRGELRPSHYELQLPCQPNKAWITCMIKDKGRVLPKTQVKYTKLFFLDEVTAFAAGHRPCYSCQRQRYRDFVDAWENVTRCSHEDLDVKLAEERGNGDLPKKTYSSMISRLPSGTLVTLPQ